MKIWKNDCVIVVPVLSWARVDQQFHQDKQRKAPAQVILVTPTLLVLSGIKERRSLRGHGRAAENSEPSTDQQLFHQSSWLEGDNAPWTKSSLNEQGQRKTDVFNLQIEGLFSQVYFRDFTLDSPTSYFDMDELTLLLLLWVSSLNWDGEQMTCRPRGRSRGF